MVNRLTSPKSVLTSVEFPAPEESALISSPRVTSHGRTFSIAEQATACAAERRSIITLGFRRVIGPNRAAVIIYEAVAKLMLDAGLIVLCAAISPFRAERQMVRELVQEGEFIEVFVDAPIELCMQRDPKGLYAKARAGLIKNFTGFDSPYDRPEAPDLWMLSPSSI